MFEAAVIDYWGRHEECPLFGGDLSRMEFCCAQMLTERQAYDWIMLMNDAHPRSVPKAKHSRRIAKRARADCAFVFAREFLSGCCLWPSTSSMT